MGEGEYTTKATKVPLGGAFVVGIGPDPRRVALLVSGDGLGGVMTIQASGAPDTNHRVIVSTTTQFAMYFRDVGPLVSYGWDVANAGGAMNAYFVEVLYLGKR